MQWALKVDLALDRSYTGLACRSSTHTVHYFLGLSGEALQDVTFVVAPFLLSLACYERDVEYETTELLTTPVEIIQAFLKKL